VSGRRYNWSDRHDTNPQPRTIESARSLVHAGGAAAGVIIAGVLIWSALSAPKPPPKSKPATPDGVDGTS
jgi:hypothetical protein